VTVTKIASEGDGEPQPLTDAARVLHLACVCTAQPRGEFLSRGHGPGDPAVPRSVWVQSIGLYTLNFPGGFAQV